MGKIQVIFTPVDVNAEPFSDGDKVEIDQWSLTPVFDGVDQEPIVKAKDDLADVTVLVDQGVAVYAKWAWVDDAGNKSLAPVNTETVLAADVTPPLNPQTVPGVRLGDEVNE